MPDDKPAGFFNPVHRVLRDIRRARSLTQEQAAERMGVDRSTVWSWENDRTRPSKAQEGLWLVVMDTSPDEAGRRMCRVLFERFGPAVDQAAEDLSRRPFRGLEHALRHCGPYLPAPALRVFKAHARTLEAQLDHAERSVFEAEEILRSIVAGFLEREAPGGRRGGAPSKGEIPKTLGP